MTKCQDMRKPNLCLQQALGRLSQVLVSAVVPSHTFITQALPRARKDPHRRLAEGCGLAQVTVDDPECWGATGLWDERKTCLVTQSAVPR